MHESMHACTHVSMCRCMCMSMCMYMCVCMCLHACMYVCMQVGICSPYVCVYTHACRCVCIHLFTCCLSTFMCIHLFRAMCICVHLHRHIYVYLHIYMNTYTHGYTWTHDYIGPQVLQLQNSETSAQSGNETLVPLCLPLQRTSLVLPIFRHVLCTAVGRLSCRLRPCNRGGFGRRRSFGSRLGAWRGVFGNGGSWLAGGWHGRCRRGNLTFPPQQGVEILDDLH